MAKILKLILTAFIILNLIPVSGEFSASADEYYPMACSGSEWEVSYIENDGSLSKVSCHGSYTEAKKAMKANENYVVRYAYSYSATRIVAMNGGIAYTYPNRRGSSTMNLYQDPEQTGNSRYKDTFVSKGYEMNYVDTYSVNADGRGYIRADMNGFEGFADLEYTDLVPFKYINNGIPVYLGGSRGGLCSYGSEYPYLVKLEQNYYMIKTNGNYKDLVYTYHYAYGTNGKACLSYSLSVDNAQNYLDAGMKEGVKYYSSDGINFYSDYRLNDFVAAVYNYYQFLSFRTKTGIKASVFDSYIADRDGSVLKDEGKSFISAEDTYGVNALLVYAMACLESAYGTSGYARNRYNLFGWNAYDDSPNDASYFSSVASCVETQMGRYINWFIDYTNWRYFGPFVGNKGAGLNVKYASDPYWGQNIAAIAYNIDKYANSKNGKLTDHNRYQLAYVNANYNDTLYSSDIAWDAKFYKSATSSSVLFTGGYGSHYQKDMIIPIIGEEGERYKVQCPNPVEDGELVTEDGKLEYSWSGSAAYINKKDVKILYKQEETPEEPVVEPDHDPITIIDAMDLKDGILSLGGIGIITNINMTDASKTSHVVEIYDLANMSKVDSFVCENTDTSWYSINDGFSYQYGGFKGSYDVSKLPKGSYVFRLKTSYNGQYEVNDIMKTAIRSLAQFAYVKDDISYHLSTNDVYSYRIELDVADDLFDYGSIMKTSQRTSLATIDTVTYEEADGKNYIVFDGAGMIYYLNYNSEDIAHNLYLVNDSQKIKAQTTTHACSFDFQSFYDSAYNMDNICYTAKADLSELNGDYRLILEVENGQYYDLVEMVNRFNTRYAVLDTDVVKTAFKADNVRYRTILNVSH